MRKKFIIICLVFSATTLLAQNIVTDEKAFEFQLEETDKVSFTIEADKASPLMNPCFIFYNSSCVDPVVKLKIERM